MKRLLKLLRQLFCDHSVTNTVYVSGLGGAGIPATKTCLKCGKDMWPGAREAGR